MIYICRYLILHPEETWHSVPELPRAAIAVLDRDFVRSTSTVEQAQVSSDGTTTKLLVRLQDGMQVEAVVMTYTKGGARSMHVMCPRMPSQNPFVATALRLFAIQAPYPSVPLACALASIKGQAYCRSTLALLDYTGCREEDSEDGHAVLGQQRSTLCVSSQVGCQMGCTFCATGGCLSSVRPFIMLMQNLS